MKIRITRKRLTDGSAVYDVHLENVVIGAYDRRHAEQLAEDLCAAIDRHATDMPRIEYCY